MYSFSPAKAFELKLYSSEPATNQEYLMRLRSLECRIVILFLVLILTVQFAGFFAIRTGTQENARAAIREELANDLDHDMGLKVGAEDIETIAAWELLAIMGGDQGQGYDMSKPMAADQLTASLEKWMPPSLDFESLAEARLTAS